jgi:hypothetical protein
MGQIFSKCCCCYSEEANEQPAATVPAPTTPSKVANEPTDPPVGTNLETAASPNDPPSAPTAGTTAPVSRERREQLPNSVRAISNHKFKRDFWKEAVDMLPNEKVPEEWLTGGNGDDVVGLVKAKVKECQDKQWKIEINGEEVVMREVFKKTLGWVEKLAVVGDAVIEHAPSYAALPWAGFRFLLKVKHSHCFLFTSFIAHG